MLKKMFYLTIAILIFLTGCGSNHSYKTELPEEPSSEMLAFVSHLVSNQKNFLYKRDGTYVFSNKSFNPEHQEVEYFTITEENLHSLYTDFFISNLGTDFVWNLREAAKEKMFQKIEKPTENSLPFIQIKEDNHLYIKTKDAEDIYDLTELLSKYDLQPNDEIYMNVGAVIEEEFQLDINNLSKNDSGGLEVSLFIKQDLSKLVISQPFGEELAQNLHDNKLADFEDLFIKLDSDKGLLKTSIGSQIWNEDNKELIEVNESDYLNNTGEFVYLNGNELEDDTQHRIQRVSDYLEGNNEYYSQFELDYEGMGEEIGINSFGPDMVKVMYLNERYAVLFVQFAGGITGTTGSTNVLVDLKEDTIYLVDLDLS